MSSPQLRPRAYLVDDEPLGLARLAQLLEATSRVEIVGKTTDPEAALPVLQSETPDVMFLDVHMPGMNGFELLSHLRRQPLVIFTTAYDRYALQAFKVNSIAYLLKPLDPAQLEEALDKLDGLREARHSLPPVPWEKLVQELNDAMRSGNGYPERITSCVGRKTQFLELALVSHFVAEDKLTYAVTRAKRHVVHHSIAELEKKLDPRLFVRIHRAVVVNMAWVEELHSRFDGCHMVRLKGNEPVELPVARERVRALKRAASF